MAESKTGKPLEPKENPKAPEMLIVRVSFRDRNAGMIPAGTVVMSDDPVVKGREHLFTRAADRVRNTRRD